MKNNGVTLVELLVTLSIIGILLIAVGLQYTGWIRKYSVESTTKDIYSDFMEARTRAMQQNREHFAILVDATSYAMIDDENGDGDWDADANFTLDAGDAMLPTFPKTVEYDLTWNGAVPANIAINFEEQGIVQPTATPLGGTLCIFTDEDGDGISEVDPDYDCIVISQTRINMGKLASQAVGDCNAANCDTK
jgi:prepilin-type N-terminal cleavage/methylation domain-containing protein